MYFNVANLQKADYLPLQSRLLGYRAHELILERLKHSDPHTHTVEEKYSLQEFPYLVICSRSRTFSSKPRS